MNRIYMDFNASTPIAEEVVEAMRPFFTDHYGNPSSGHWAGAPAEGAVERARSQVARLLGCEPDETVFTSGGTEAGTIERIGEIGRIARERDVLFHSDAARSVGKIATHVEDLTVDLLSVAGHKVYAPKGVGALYVRRGLGLEPLVHGASHESGHRAGTENVLLDVGLGAASEVAEKWVGMPEVRKLRDLFWKRLREAFGDQVILNGHPSDRLPNTLNVSFVGRSGPEVLSRLDGVAASTGSACHSGAIEISPVLQAMGVRPKVAMGASRFGLGRDTSEDEIRYVVQQLKRIGHA